MKNTKMDASQSCAWVAFILLGISWDQLVIWCRPLKSKTPWFASMEQQTLSYMWRITMQCYVHTLWCMVTVNHTLDQECMLIIASIVELRIDALSQNNVENTSAFADVTLLTMAEFDKLQRCGWCTWTWWWSWSGISMMNVQACGRNIWLK